MIIQREMGNPSERPKQADDSRRIKLLIWSLLASFVLLGLADLFSSGLTLLFALLSNPNAILPMAGPSEAGFDAATSAEMIRVGAWISAYLGLFLYLGGFAFAVNAVRLGRTLASRLLPGAVVLFCCGWLLFSVIHRGDALHMRNPDPIATPRQSDN